MRCEECTSAEKTKGLWNRYDNRKCVWCAARIIQAIGCRDVGRDEIARRRTEVLKESVAAGLDEALIRKLAKGPMALEPEPVVVKETKK